MSERLVGFSSELPLQGMIRCTSISFMYVFVVTVPRYTGGLSEYELISLAHSFATRCTCTQLASGQWANFLLISCLFM